MKKYLLCSIFCLGSFTFGQTGQVGIDTANPKALLHVDGAKDNPQNNSVTLSDSQIQNDVVITNQGNLGIGTITPSVKVELNNGSTNGAIKIVDGTQGDGKVLISDANGVGTWQFPNSFKAVALGVYPSPKVDIVSDGSANTMGAMKYTRIYIDLTPGKWIVNAGLTVRSNEALGQRFWMHAYLSSSTTAIQHTGFSHLGSAGNVTSYANLIFGNPNTANNTATHQGSNFISGSSIIQVTGNTRIYLLIDNSNSLPRNDERVGSYIFSTDAYENYFYAIPVE